VVTLAEMRPDRRKVQAYTGTADPSCVGLGSTSAQGGGRCNDPGSRERQSPTPDVFPATLVFVRFDAPG
jgi:hypothetical protein